MEMTSPTYGKVTIEGMVEKIKAFMDADPDQQYTLTVGTDSQNFDKTKTVLVVAVRRIGKGGIFFYDVKRLPLISNLRQKIYEETKCSIEMATILTERLKIASLPYKVAIHVDIGQKGKTRELIPEIVGWVTSLGYECEIKPYSWGASGIANRISK